MQTIVASVNVSWSLELTETLRLRKASTSSSCPSPSRESNAASSGRPSCALFCSKNPTVASNFASSRACTSEAPMSTSRNTRADMQRQVNQSGWRRPGLLCCSFQKRPYATRYAQKTLRHREYASNVASQPCDQKLGTQQHATSSSGVLCMLGCRYSNMLRCIARHIASPFGSLNSRATQKVYRLCIWCAKSANRWEVPPFGVSAKL